MGTMWTPLPASQSAPLSLRKRPRRDSQVLRQPVGESAGRSTGIGNDGCGHVATARGDARSGRVGVGGRGYDARDGQDSRGGGQRLVEYQSTVKKLKLIINTVKKSKFNFSA